MEWSFKNCFDVSVSEGKKGYKYSVVVAPQSELMKP